MVHRKISKKVVIMKKSILSITLIATLLCILFAGCKAEDPVITTTQPPQTTVPATTVPSTPPATTVPPTTQTEPYVPEISPDTVGIYIPAANGTAARKHITEFKSVRTAKKDIDCFEILATQAEQAEGSSFRSIWNAAWGSHENAENAKIGFHISFTLTSGEAISKQLLKPSDSASFYDYLEIYLYDDVHVAPGVWYTHLEDKDMTEETVITSIKLTSGSKIAQVGDITLTAFIYNGDDCFGADGSYIGLVSETIVIQNSGS